MLYAAIDIHKQVFQAAVLDSESGALIEERFSADRESLDRWATKWSGRVVAVAVEATTGWRWVWRELVGRGFDVRLAESVQARALLRTDLLPEAYVVPRSCAIYATCSVTVSC